MRRIVKVSLIAVLFSLIMVQPMFAGCWVVPNPYFKYVKSEFPFDDFYIYYKIPKNASYDLKGLTSKARKTLSKSTVSRKKYKNFDLIEIIAGGRARAFGVNYSGNYKGLNKFIKEIKFKYWEKWCYTG